MASLGTVIRQVTDKWSKSIAALLLLVMFGVGCWVGWLLRGEKQFPQSSPIRLHQINSSHSLISPLLDCDNYSEENTLMAKSLEKALKGTEEKAINDPAIEHLSIYYRDLNNGPTMGFNENERFTPASLLKVPLMIAYLKKAENEPGILKKEVRYSNDVQVAPEDIITAAPVALEKGKSYAIDELIRYMIVYSDNAAAALLLKNIDMDFLMQVYKDLSITVPGMTGETENFMTVKDYASFFRILYNASYLDPEMSEKALELLSTTEFKDGLIAGIPSGTAVAHKFGERNNNGLLQLHDCGIIYKDDNPYLLCVMTRGNNFDRLKNIIKEVSKKVWEDTDR